MLVYIALMPSEGKLSLIFIQDQVPPSQILELPGGGRLPAHVLVNPNLQLRQYRDLKRVPIAVIARIKLWPKKKNKDHDHDDLPKKELKKGRRNSQTRVRYTGDPKI